MIIIGINAFFDYFGMKDSSVTLIVNGKVKSFVSEDSLSGVKYGKHLLPEKCIKYILSNFNINPKEIDIITFGFDFKKELGIGKEGINILKKFLKNNFNGFNGKIKFINHHDSHAFSAYYLSGFKKAGIIVLDGGGEGDTSGFVGFINNGVINKIKDFSIKNSSVGQLYYKVSKFILSGESRGEGTVMALSGYGSKELDLTSIISFTDNSFNIINSPEDELILTFLENKFGYNYKLKNNFQNAADLAYSLQKNIEKVYDIIYNLLPNEYRENICISGGCGLNINCNTLIYQKKHTKNIFVDIAPSDLGVSLGSSLCIVKEYQNINRFDLGQSFNDEYIIKMFKSFGLKYKKVSLKEFVNHIFYENKVLGFFTGGREAGERALGFRSIIARSDCLDNKNRINQIKGREFFRPIALSILEGFENKYFLNPISSYTMSLNFKSNNKNNDDIIAGLHIDNTCRYQSVSEKSNPDFYKLLIEYLKETNYPCLLNTSLNGKGKPIINTPDEAIAFLYSSGLDGILFNGKYLILK